MPAMLSRLPALFLLAHCVFSSPLSHPLKDRQAQTDANAAAEACRNIEYGGRILKECSMDQKAAISPFFSSCMEATYNANSQVIDQIHECELPCYGITQPCFDICYRRFTDDPRDDEDEGKREELAGCNSDCDETVVSRCTAPCRAAAEPARQAIGAAGIQCCQNLNGPAACLLKGNVTNKPPVIEIIWPKNASDPSSTSLIIYGNEFNISLPRIYVPDAPVDPNRIPTFAEWSLEHSGDYYDYCSAFGTCPKLPQNSGRNSTSGGATSNPSNPSHPSASSQVPDRAPTSTASPAVQLPRAGSFTFDDCMCDQGPTFQRIFITVKESFAALFAQSQKLAASANCSAYDYSPQAFPSYTRNAYLSKQAGLPDTLSIYSLRPSLFDCQGVTGRPVGSFVYCSGEFDKYAYPRICYASDDSGCASTYGPNTYVVLCNSNSAEPPSPSILTPTSLQSSSRSVSFTQSSSSSSSTASLNSISASQSVTSSRFTGFPRPVPSATPSTAPAVCKSGGARAFQNFCTFLDAFQTELTFICGASAVLALVQPEFIPVVLEFCAGGAGNAALLGVLKSLTEGAIGGVTGTEIPGDASSSACFLLHDYCGENDQFTGLKRASYTPYRRQSVPDQCTPYATFTPNPLVATNCDNANVLMDLQSACAGSLFGPASVDSALQRLCGFSAQLARTLPAVCQISSYIEDNKPAVGQACEAVVASGNSSTMMASPTSKTSATAGIPTPSVLPLTSVGTATTSIETTITPVGTITATAAAGELDIPASASATTSSFVPTPTAGGETCQLVKHYGDSPDSPDGEPEVPEIPDYPGGYYYLCADGSVPPLSILPGTSVTASSNAGSASIMAPTTTKTSQAGCTMTRFKGDSPDTPDTPDSPDGQPEVPELPEISQDPSDPGYYWMCV